MHSLLTAGLSGLLISGVMGTDSIANRYKVARHTLELTSRKLQHDAALLDPRKRYSQPVASLDKATLPGIAPLRAEISSHFFFANLTLGGQEFSFLVDTGSSDLWVAAKGSQCQDRKHHNISLQNCGFQNFYTKSPTYEQVSNQNFHVRYQDRTFSTGAVGKETVTIADITVHNQIFRLADTEYFNAFEQYSGVLGLAFPLATSVYPGLNTSLDYSKINNLPDDTIFASMHRQKLIDPVFVVALRRNVVDGDIGGVLALGGLPLTDRESLLGPLVSTPIMKDVNFDPEEYTLFHVSIDSVSWSPATQRRLISQSQSSLVNRQVALGFVDTGCPTLRLPANIVQQISNAFTPPGSYREGFIEVECDAIPPVLTFKIGNSDFSLQPDDLVRITIALTFFSSTTPLTLSLFHPLFQA